MSFSMAHALFTYARRENSTQQDAGPADETARVSPCPLLLVRITLKSWEAVVVFQLIERLGHGTPAHSVSPDKRLPIDIDEHDGLMPRRAIHPDRRCLRSRARIDALPQAARRPAMTPARPHLALAFWKPSFKPQSPKSNRLTFSAGTPESVLSRERFGPGVSSGHRRAGCSPGRRGARHRPPRTTPRGSHPAGSRRRCHTVRSGSGTRS